MNRDLVKENRLEDLMIEDSLTKSVGVRRFGGIPISQLIDYSIEKRTPHRFLLPLKCQKQNFSIFRGLIVEFLW